MRTFNARYELLFGRNVRGTFRNGRGPGFEDLMNKFLEFISRGLHQIQRTFFPDLEHEAGLLPEILIRLTYILEIDSKMSEGGI